MTHILFADGELDNTRVSVLEYLDHDVNHRSAFGFSDFLPTIAEVGKATIPSDRIIDGRSFLPQLKGEKGNSRDTVLVHYDKDPNSAKPTFRRVRIAYDGRYKRYLDGNKRIVADHSVSQVHPLLRD
jgi:hypothetical protein